VSKRQPVSSVTFHNVNERVDTAVEVHQHGTQLVEPVSIDNVKFKRSYIVSQSEIV